MKSINLCISFSTAIASSAHFNLIKQLAYIFVTIDIVLLLIINIPRGLRIFRWLSCATLQPNRSPLYQVTKEISDE